MNNWKIGVRISAAFALIIAINAAVGLFAFSRLKNIDSLAMAVSEHNVPAVIALSHMQGRIMQMTALLRDQVNSTDAAEEAQLETKIVALRAAASEDMKTYESLPSSDEEKTLYAKVTEERAALREIVDAINKESRQATKESNATTVQMLDTQLRPKVESYTDAIQAVVDLNNKGSREGLKSVRDAVGTTIIGVVLALLLSIGLGVLVTITIVRGIVRPLAQAVEALERVADGDLTATLDVDSKDEVGQMAGALNQAVQKLAETLQEVTESAANANASSQQLAAASEAIASGAQEQAASLEETSASLEQITAAVRQSANNAHQASQLAASSKDSALQGQEVVSKAISAMSDINVASAKISDIISTIDEIAFQTNLLAVNAAVEAARAGEEGRGFAVVASEVRSLAQRSALAAKEIKGLIQDTLRKVQAGSALVNRSGETLQGIVGSVKRVTDIVSEIAAASGEQSSGIEQVNSAMTQMDQVTQSNSAQTEELSATAQSLSEQASHLMELVSLFTLNLAATGKREGQEFQPHVATVGSALRWAGFAQQAILEPPRQAKPPRGNGTTKPDQPGRGSKRIQSRKASLAIAAPSETIASDASFQEF